MSFKERNKPRNGPVKQRCCKCHAPNSSYWYTLPEGGTACFNCYQDDDENNIASENPDETETDDTDSKILRKSTRSTRFRLDSVASVSNVAPKKPTPKLIAKPKPKKKGRRTIMKTAPKKAPRAVATVVTSESLFHKGTYFQIGDVVSVVDHAGDTYYAQIRGLLTDEHCEKSAVLTWLLPTQASPAASLGFDPCTYIVGPDEHRARPLSCMQFIAHAPTDYFKSNTSPYPSVDDEFCAFGRNVIWTNLDPVMAQ